MNRRIRQLSQAAVILLSGAIIARLLSDDLPQVLQYLARVEYAWLLAAAALLWAGMLVGRYTWKMVMRAVGHDLPFLDAMRLISMFQVASYIPGGFWHFLGIAYWAEDEDVPKKVTAVGTVINAGSAVIVALLLFFAVAPFYLPASSVLTYLPLLVAVPAGLVAVHPRVFYPVMNRGLELLGRDPIDPVLSYAELLEVFAVNLLSRAFTGAALYALAASVTQVNPALFPALTAFYAGAWAVGFLVLFMPGGLGVREVTAVGFFSVLMAEPLATLVVLVYRAMALLSEFLFAAAFWLATREPSQG